jgi:hypothetical protein
MQDVRVKKEVSEETGDVDYNCVQGAVKETGNEALSFSLGAASKNRPC